MRLRLLGLLLSMMMLAHAAPSPALAQAPSEAELEALGSRVDALNQAGKFGEAIPLAQQYADGEKALHGGNSPQYATALNNLAQLLQAVNRLAEAEPLYRRALAIDEKSFRPDHPAVTRDVNNLAQFLHATNRLAEAEPLLRRALALAEKSFGPDHPNVAISLNNLAQFLQDTNRPKEAEPLMRRALAIDEKSFGPDHPIVATSLNNLALLLADTNRMAEAEPLYRRALAVLEKSLGTDHPDVAASLSNLAKLHEEQNDWAGAAALCLRAQAIMTGAKAFGEAARGVLGRAAPAQNTGGVRACARAHYHADALSLENRSEGFELAQWALQNSAADALSAMSARFAKGDAALSKLVREEQDLRNTRETAYRSLDAAAGKADSRGAEKAREDIAKISGDLTAKQEQLRRDFPDYADLANPKPLPLGQAQQLLGERQALVLFLDVPQYGKVPGETTVFAVTRKEARWVNAPLDTIALQKRVAALRCGLDYTNWREDSGKRGVCKQLLETEASAKQLPPFEAGKAFELYRDLFGGIEDLVKDKSLLIVPSGALTQLPFSVLVTAELDKALPRFEAYKTAVWLGEQQAITVLPSAGALKALHAAKPSSASDPFIGFGNPLLTGFNGTDKRAWAKQDCSKAEPPKPAHSASLLGGFFSWLSQGGVKLEKLRRLQPLPETADELCAVAGNLGVPGPGLDKAIYLGERATVRQIKALSQSGELARARVVHFATHGLLAGETARFAENRAEPALVLTPPGKASEEDNGLLTASEAAQLHMDADWVVMSACNTAAGSGDGAEALSGLARAFFYAGARSLLVSHWEVSRRNYDRRREYDEGRARSRPRRGAAPLHVRAHCGRPQKRQPERSSQHLGALRAGG